MTISDNEKAVWQECGASEQELLEIASAGGVSGFAQDPIARERAQDVLDHCYQERIPAVRNALRKLGWTGEAWGVLRRATSEGAELTIKHVLQHTGAGRNVTGVRWVGGVGVDLEDLMVEPATTRAAQLDAAVMARHEAPALTSLASSIPLSHGPNGRGFLDAIDSLRLAMEAAAIPTHQDVIANVIRTTLDAYANIEEGVNELLAAAAEIVDSFPGCETDEEMNGGDVVERLVDIYPRLASAVRRFRPQEPSGELEVSVQSEMQMSVVDGKAAGFGR